MREAIGQTFIVNLILVFVGILSALLVGSVAYSKAYKVKNRIVTIIEKHGGWAGWETDASASGRDITQREVEASLKEIGYHLNLNGGVNCGGRFSNVTLGPNVRLVYGVGPGSTRHNATLTTYDYCVYEHDAPNGRGRYYTVTTFMQFNIPVFGGWLKFPVHGKTKTLYNVGVANLHN